jgi:predicted hotdog family 3-hydroxylacyl-ACP dehydratase
MPELTRDAWSHLIPHSGTMCLIDVVRAHDAASITCATQTHRRPDNPLRADGRLGAVCGVEYAAQAAAIHSGLVNADRGRRPKSGYLAAVRGVQMQVDRLDDIDTELLIHANQVMLDETSCIYEFTVTGRDRELLRGRLTVMQNF